jgi:hypothetical protein
MRDLLLQAPAGEAGCLPRDFFRRMILGPRTETRAQMIRDPLARPDEQDDREGDEKEQVQERDEDREGDEEPVMTTVLRESPSQNEYGSRIASISQVRPSGAVALTASTAATLSRQRRHTFRV